ncbi:MAG TPA: hypothetical protein PKL13_00245 [bacterium]|nr:hypothetical protein [bacterium]
MGGIMIEQVKVGTDNVLSLEDQAEIYVQLGQLLKKSNLSASKSFKRLINEMISDFKGFKPCGNMGDVVVWPKMPLRFLNFREIGLFQHYFYVEQDVVLNSIQEMSQVKIEPYVLRMNSHETMGTLIELATAIQFGIIKYFPGDCISVSGDIYFYLSNCNTNPCWRIHNGLPSTAFQKFRVGR